MALWTPAEISTALWLDAADSSTLFDAIAGGSLPASGSSVGRWEDKSGNSRHVSQSDPASRPLRQTTVQNGKDVLRFDGLNDFLTTSTHFALTGNPSFSVFLAGNYTITGLVVGWGVNQTLNGAGTVSNVFAYMGENNYSMGSASPANTPMQVVYTKSPGPINTTSAWYLNGAINNGTIHSNQTPNIRSAPFVVGRLNTFALYQSGDTYEIIVLDTLASLATRQLIEGYLAWKWGTQASLPANHPYKNAAPTKGGLAAIIASHYAALGI